MAPAAISYGEGEHGYFPKEFLRTSFIRRVIPECKKSPVCYKDRETKFPGFFNNKPLDQQGTRFIQKT